MSDSNVRRLHVTQPQGGSSARRSVRREALGLLRRRAALGTALALKVALPSLQLAPVVPACAERHSKPSLGTSTQLTTPAGGHHAAGGSPRASPLSQSASPALEPPHMQLDDARDGACDGARDGARDDARDGARDSLGVSAGAPSPQSQTGAATGALSPQATSASRPPSAILRPTTAASRGQRHLNAAAAAAGGVQGGVAVEGRNHVTAAGVSFPLSTAACASPSVGGKRPFNYLYLQPQQPQAQYTLSRGAKLAAATAISGGASRL
jgi:hypothetical protein